jgi:hypothetical protein
MGANDRQQMPVAGEKEKFRSEAWTKEYEARVARLATLARDAGKPMLWVGMPAFQSSALTADMTTLNTIYRASVEKTGGEFVDIWDGFVDENGKFVISGSDINGQQVRLRGSDGINFTKAGKRKLAFYVEKEIRRLLGMLPQTVRACRATSRISLSPRLRSRMRRLPRRSRSALPTRRSTAALPCSAGSRRRAMARACAKSWSRRARSPMRRSAASMISAWTRPRHRRQRQPHRDRMHQGQALLPLLGHPRARPEDP